MARQNDHTQALDLISAYLDKQVTAQEQQFMEQHLRTCADCRAQLEATRTLITALHAMPALKASRSFVLPREMARKPGRSILMWYPALRLATAVAVVAFIVVFAGDLLASRSGSRTAPISIPAAAPASLAVTVQAEAQSTAQDEAQSAGQDAARGVGAANAAEATALPLEAAAPAEPPHPGMVAAAQPTTTASEPTSALPETAADTAMGKAAAVTPTLEATAAAGGAANQAGALLADTATPAAAPEPERQATAEAVSSVSPIDPLRLIEIGLLVLIVVLGAATLIARRSA
jgi:hypothetical protein